MTTFDASAKTKHLIMNYLQIKKKFCFRLVPEFKQFLSEKGLFWEQEQTESKTRAIQITLIFSRELLVVQPILAF